MSFAIGTVQDAGLIFLSSMANTIADEMLADGETELAILSTTLVLLSLGTAFLGVILILIGKFKLTNVVSYLPMPVVGGEWSSVFDTAPSWLVSSGAFRVPCVYRLLLRSSRGRPVHIQAVGGVHRLGLSRGF